jgi:hypothetical protein
VRVTITSSSIDDKNDPPLWIVRQSHIMEENDEFGTFHTVVDGVWKEFPEYPGYERIVISAIPWYGAMARAAEYNIDPDDIDTLLDVIMNEGALPRDWWDDDNPDNLWNAPDIDTARKKYLEQIAMVKMRNRMSTRKKPGQLDDHPLDLLRRNYTWKPADMALASLGVLLHRHRKGSQVLDPAVAKSLVYMERAVGAQPETANTVVTEGVTKRRG